MLDTNNSTPGRRQPIFNLPPAIVILIAVLVGIHAARTTLLSPEANFDLILRFGFIPLRVLEPDTIGTALPGGPMAALWSFVTHALLHGNWAHLIFNSFWLLAFGSAVAWRFGSVRFFLFSAAGAICGALTFLAFHTDGLTPMIGVSGAVSAHMAAASRFMFSSSGPFTNIGGPLAYHHPAPPLTVALLDRRVLAFLAIFFGLNILFGFFLAGSIAFTSGAIAWEAHLGGFLCGLLLFGYFDPVASR